MMLEKKEEYLMTNLSCSYRSCHSVFIQGYVFHLLFHHFFVYKSLTVRASSGRIPRDAPYSGNVRDLGNIWVCTSTSKNETSNIPAFNGKYCPFQVINTVSIYYELIKRRNHCQ